MAANGSVEEQGAAGELDDISAKIKINGAKATLNGSVFNTLDSKDPLIDSRHPDALASRLAVAGAPWITTNNKNKVIQSSAAPLTFCSQNDPRRTLRIDRAGSTESVVTTSGGDSSSSEPGSPSRPVTPQMTMAPVPAFECLRADSEDSGLGPSPAKSLTSPTSPEGSVSPIRFDDRSDSLLDLSPRTDNSDDLLLSEENNGCCDEYKQTSTAIPQLSPKGGSSFQFLLASKNCVVNTNEPDDFCIHFPTRVTNSEEEHAEDRSHFDENPDEELQHSPLKTFNTADCSDVSNVESVSRVESIPQDYVEDSLLNPKVVLIRSDFGGQYTEESCSQQSSSAGTAVGDETVVDCTPTDDGACKWLNCDRSADANTTVTDLIDHIRQCHVQNQPEDAESFVCLWVGCKVYAKPSCSRSWLERHVLLHGGSKPFRCIVAGCRQRFGTEVALQRHVNSHFPQAGRHPNNPHQQRLARNRRKNYKHRRRPQSRNNAVSSAAITSSGSEVESISSFRTTAARKYAMNTLNRSFEKLNLNEYDKAYIYPSEERTKLYSNSECNKIVLNSSYGLSLPNIIQNDYKVERYLTICDITRYATEFVFMTPNSDVRNDDDKSKDFFDDATMEYVRHNLYKLSCIEGMVTSAPPAAIKFRSTVIGKRKCNGKVNFLLHWSPENMIPDNWIAEDELNSNTEKTIPISKLPHEALQLPVFDAFCSAGIISPPGKRKRK